MDLSARSASPAAASALGSAAPPPYDPLLPSPSLPSHPTAPTTTSSHPPPSQSPTTPAPAPMDTPSETPHDLFCLAKEYERRGRLPDAANLYLKASMNGHLSAMVCYATHLVPTDERAAFVWFRAAAERGDPRAWYELGQLLARGRYFEVNAVDAARCWKRAAQMGDNTGKSALGLCYIRGFGVKQDLDKGVEIVKQVADVHNDVTAMKNLAWIFRYGKGVPKNLEEADYWDNRAKEQEKVMLHISSREQILFGRGRASRHSKHKPRDSERPSSSRPAVRDTTSPAANPPERDSVPVDEDDRRNPSRDKEANRTNTSNKTGIADELESRLRDVADEPTRLSPHPISRSPVARTPVEQDERYAERSLSPNPATGPVVSGDPSNTVPTVTSQPTPVESSQPERDLYRDDNKVRKRPDPVLGAEVADLGFVRKAEAEPQEAQPYNTPSAEIQRVQQSAPQRISKHVEGQPSGRDGQRSSTTPVLGQAVISKSDVDEQFNTPDQEIHSADVLRASEAIEPNAIPEDPHSREIDEEPRARYPPRPLNPPFSPTDLANQGQQPDTPDAGSTSPFVVKPPENLGPGVRNRKFFFENEASKNIEEPIVGASDFRRSPTYTLRSPEEIAQQEAERDAHYEEDPMPIDNIEDDLPEEDLEPEEVDMPDSGATEEPSPEEELEEELEEDDIKPLVPSQPRDGPGLDDLKHLLDLYPSNPMRADSQAPLLSLLTAMQTYAVNDAEAFSVLEERNGFPKVIVAMVSQHEEEQIQEQGLHAFVRLVRAMQSSARETAILASYADCFRIVQGKADVVVPKGTAGVDERASGAVQAVVNAMRRHAEVRRVQLAGCAAISEIASVSSSCRSLAYENGSINLVLTCLRHRSTSAASTIHDMACRAIGSFCAGKENFAFKEAFSNAGTIPDLLAVLQLWGHSDDVKSEVITTVTKSCCTALRHITDGCSNAAGLCVQSYAYHHLVRVMVLRRADVSVCTLALAALTSITRNAGAVAEKSLLDAKPLPEVLTTMQVHADNPLFVRKVLDFMESLGSFNSMKEEIVVAGGISFASDIIQQGGNDALLLERASGVIEKLCRTNASNQEILGSTGGVQSLTALLNSHQRLPGVSERVLLALTSSCANNNHNQREAVRVGTPEELVRVLSVYSAKNAKVVAAASSAMSAMVVPKNTVVAQTFAGLKAPELVVRAMKRHPDSVLVQENGSAAIAGFCEADPRIMTALLKSGITSVLVVALQRFLHKQTAVVQVVRAMRAITNEACPEDSFRFKSKLLTDRSNESSLPEIFHTALSYHKKSLPETANVIISICATINRLCMRSVSFKNEVGKDGIVEELKRLVEKTAEFKDLGALQPVLATICTLVLESEENKNRFHAVGGVEAILDVMQKWKHDTYVLEHCCAALRYSCNEHFGNCDEVKNHNGVRSILGVMEMHPENVNVTLWCCLTLADLCKGDEELQSSATVVQGIRKVVSAMNMFSQNSRFLASACEFLRAASVCNVDNQERIVRLGGRTAIVKALETHPTDNTLTESAAYALLQIQDVPDPRTSVDSTTQLSPLKRLSRDLRRSGSSSNRSRSSKGRMGRKSLSFTSRRKVTNESDQDNPDSEVEGERRPSKTSSLINLQRLRLRRRNRHQARPTPEELDDEEEEGGADAGYDDYDDPPHEDNDPQMD